MAASRSSYTLQKNNRLEPNFSSIEYKKQAKEIFKRRMQYDPRASASKSRERSTHELISQVHHTQPIVTKSFHHQKAEELKSDVVIKPYH